MPAETRARSALNSIKASAKPSTDKNDDDPSIIQETLNTSNETEKVVYSDEIDNPKAPPRASPKQEAIANKIAEMQIELDILLKKSVLSDEESSKKIELEGEIEKCNKEIKSLQRKAEASRRSRRKHQPYPLKAGRPTVETVHPQLQQAIIATLCNQASSSSSNGETGSPTKPCKSLNELKKVLSEEYNIEIPRSTLYTRLLPKNTETNEGKRHINTVPVRLPSSKNTK